MDPILREESEAWFYNPEGEEDQTTPHKFVPNRPVSADDIQALCILIWKLDADTIIDNPLLDNPLLEAIKTERGYKYSDMITFALGHIQNFEEKAAHFFVEHFHAIEEIRFVLEGRGYFDVRNLEDNWIRLKITKGDFVILPPGMYHRFSLLESLYIRALRLFIELPEWIEENRPKDEYVAKYTEVARCLDTDNSEIRSEYLAKMRGIAKLKSAAHLRTVEETDDIAQDLASIAIV